MEADDSPWRPMKGTAENKGRQSEQFDQSSI